MFSRLEKGRPCIRSPGWWTGYFSWPSVIPHHALGSAAMAILPAAPPCGRGSYWIGGPGIWRLSAWGLVCRPAFFVLGFSCRLSAPWLTSAAWPLSSCLLSLCLCDCVALAARCVALAAPFAVCDDGSTQMATMGLALLGGSIGYIMQNSPPCPSGRSAYKLNLALILTPPRLDGSRIINPTRFPAL